MPQLLSAGDRYANIGCSACGSIRTKPFQNSFEYVVLPRPIVKNACARFHPIYSGCQPVYIYPSVLWTHQPGSHGRKVTRELFFSAFVLRCLPAFASREGCGRPFSSSKVESNFVCTHEKITLHPVIIFGKIKM